MLYQRFSCLGLLLLHLTGCGGAQSDVQISFVAPADGEVVAATDTLTFTVFVSDTFFLSENFGGAPQEGEGHWHLNLLEGSEVTRLTMTSDASVQLDLTPLALPPGLTSFQAQLVGNDHVPVDPPVTDILELTIQ